MVSKVDCKIIPKIFLDNEYKNLDIDVFRTFDQNEDFKESVFYTKDSNILDHNIRFSFVHKKLFSLDIPGFATICNEKNILNNFPNLKYTSLDMSDDWELLKYTHGGKFEEHTDSESDFTVLLFPPNNINILEGGELIIRENIFTTKINPSELTKFTIIFIPVGTLHKVNPVISGTRYVFKRSLKQKCIKNLTSEEKASLEQFSSKPSGIIFDRRPVKNNNSFYKCIC